MGSDDDNDEEQKEEQQAPKVEDVQKDRDSVLFSYFVTMELRNIGDTIQKNKNEKEERSKHGYDTVQFMGYKLNGTEHNIHKASHNIVEDFDQLKRVKCVGSNHCNQQYESEMKTALISGCYELFQ